MLFINEIIRWTHFKYQPPNVSWRVYSNDVGNVVERATYKKKKLVEVCFSIHNRFAWLFHSLIWDKNKVKKHQRQTANRISESRNTNRVFRIATTKHIELWERQREREKRKKLIIVFVFISFINVSLSFSFNLNDLRNLNAQLPTVAKQFYRFFSRSSTNSHCYINKGVLTYYLLCCFFLCWFFLCSTMNVLRTIFLVGRK